MQISIVIVNYNTSELLVNCINSIYNQTNIYDYEIIIVDNNSQDDSVMQIRKKFPEVIVIENEENLGYAKANNQGFKVAQGEYLLVLNSDTIILPGAIDKTYSFMVNNPQTGVIGCKLLNYDKSLQPSCRSFPSILNYFSESLFLYKIFPKSSFLGKPYMSFMNYDKVNEVDVVMGAFMMIKRETLEQTGYFDENFFMYSEETDLCFRIKQKGWKIFYYPEAQIIHLGGGSSEKTPVEMFIELHKSNFKFCNKHHKNNYALIEKWILFLGILIRSIHAGIMKIIIADSKSKLRFNRYITVLKWYFSRNKS
ncbi:MAG: glycosyltransferase family 2 protein [Candidatus Marinimicrobia bacterium]|nr:glycosyltransferase family 2 protein [Candidatus Neomarinimicrobiota bacterium]